MLVDEITIKHRWQTYFYKLLKEEQIETLCCVNWHTPKDFEILGTVGVLVLRRSNVLLEG